MDRQSTIAFNENNISKKQNSCDLSNFQNISTNSVEKNQNKSSVNNFLNQQLNTKIAPSSSIAEQEHQQCVSNPGLLFRKRKNL